MSLYKDPVEAIYKAAETLNKVTLARDEYTLGDPVEFIDPNGITNTKITIAAKSITSAYEGVATVSYRRLDLADLVRYLPTPILGYNITSVADVITVLNTYYGLNFLTSDLVAGPVTLVGDTGEVTLTAQANSKGWIGEGVLQLARGNIPIDSAIRNKTLNGVLYPNRDASKPFGEMATYWRDFTNEKPTLDLVTTETTDFTALAGVLNAVTGNAWQSTTAGRYSLLGATVLFNGLTKDYPRSNQTRGYVCVIQLGVGSLGLSGDLFLHYGIPPLG